MVKNAAQKESMMKDPDNEISRDKDPFVKPGWPRGVESCPRSAKTSINTGT